MTFQPSIAPAPVDSASHGELGCAEVEGLLTEAMLDNDVLREQVTMYERADAQRQQEMDILRAEAVRLRALVGDMGKKMRTAVDSSQGTASQIEMLLAELDAAEAAAVPVGTLVASTVGVEQMTATYRAVSKVTRGPLPPAIMVAVRENEDVIRAAMDAAGAEALTKVVKSAVRRRKAAKKPGRKVAARKSAAARRLQARKPGTSAVAAVPAMGA